MQPNKALVGLVIGLGAVIVVGVGILIYGLVQKASDPSFSFFAKPPVDAGKAAVQAPGANPLAGQATGQGTGQPTGPTNITVTLPPGTSVVSVSRADDLLMVHTVDEDDNSAVLFLDPTDGRIVRRIAFGGRR